MRDCANGSITSRRSGTHSVTAISVNSTSNPKLSRSCSDCGEGTVTLVFGATETRYNNAVALKAYLERRGKKIER